MGSALVTGGAGFIGSHLIDRLVDRGDSVVCIDDLSTGARSNLDLDSGRVEFVEADVADASTMREAMRGVDQTFDLVLHLASAASPPAYLRRPLETLDVGSNGTRNMLEIARRDGARFFLASTSEVYGDPLVHPQPESYLGNVNPIGERSVYDEAKRFAEAMTMAYARTHGVDVRIARIFNTYGPRMAPDDGRVVTNFVHQALAGDPITIYGDGAQTRSFCYVDDEVSGLVALIDGPIATPVNIGNPEEITVRAFAELVIELTNSTSEIVTRALPSDDPKQRCPDITLARSALGWEPQVGLRAGLGATIDSFAALR